MSSFLKAENVKFTQLGDALCYGIANEISQILKNPVINFNGLHFYASIGYLYLKGDLSKATIAQINHILLLGASRNTKPNEVVEKISKRVFQELWKQYDFRNVKELIAALNQFEIPQWIFPFGKELLEKIQDGLFLYESYLFYIALEDDSFYFVKTPVEELDGEENLNAQDAKIFLGYGYREISGFDENLKKVYLKAVHQEEFCHSYDILSDTYVIEPFRLVSLRKGVPYVVTHDGYFAYVLQNKIYKVKKHCFYEQYEQKEDSFLVVPKNTHSHFFLPYCVTFDGKVTPADPLVCKNYIWDEIKKIGVDEKVFFPLFYPNQSVDTLIPEPSELTIHSLLDTFRNHFAGSELSTNKEFVIFESLCGLLSEYVEPDEDITRLLYELYDMNRILDKTQRKFPSEVLYWRWKEIDTAPEEKEILKEAFVKQDYEKIKRMVVNDVIVEKESKMPGMIGSFRFYGKEIRCTAVPKGSGQVVGSQISCVTDGQPFHGRVSYDCRRNCYYIVSDSDLSKEARLQIKRDFGLREEECIFTVNRIPATYEEAFNSHKHKNRI